MATANLLQTSVSGGTQNALSLQGDGVFFPKASTTSRLALTLTTTDKGFIVYDTTDNNIYFWNGAAWESVPSSGDAGANGSVQYNDNGIVSGATNFVYDKATGNVGVGTATPFGDAGYKSIDIRGTTGGELVLGSTGVREATITADGTNGMILNTVNATPLRLFVQGVEAVRLNTTGNLVLRGGTAGANGVGVTFPAVQVPSSDANCLDDYEEGTFTPTVAGSTAAGTGTYSVQTGFYTKVGNLVTVEVFLTWTNIVGATGIMILAGLPFQSTSSTNAYSAASIAYVNNISLTASNVLTGMINPGSSFVELQQYPVGGGASTPVTIDTAGSIIYTVTYRV